MARQQWAVTRADIPVRMIFRKRQFAEDYALCAAQKTEIMHYVSKKVVRGWKRVCRFDFYGIRNLR